MGKRLPAASRGRGTPSTPNPRAAPGDNSGMLGEEAERVQLISIVSKLSQVDDEIEGLKAPVKAAQKKRSSIIGLGKAAGFTAKELERRLDEMKTGTRQNAELAAREHKHRRWLGIIDADQSALMLGEAAPIEAKDEAHWKGEGYKAGLRQMIGKPPPECPERFVQPWLAEHGRGLKEVLTANTPGMQRTVREQAAADFKADNPDAPEPGSPEAKAAERKAIAAAKASLANMTPVNDEVDGMGHRLDGAGPVDEGFEATDEELAAQTTRQAVQQVREHSEDLTTGDPV